MRGQWGINSSEINLDLENAKTEGINKYGLTKEQVLTENFGHHTLNAIKKAVEEGADLQKAFEKYSNLNYEQIEAITKHDLTKEQVLSDNFGYHTLNAIDDIKKRKKEISPTDAFEIVKGKSSLETKEFMKRYLSDTKKEQKPIHEMDLIRVLVNSGRGFGHQRAAITLMEKLREIGFNGVFDIQCDDKLNQMLFNKSKDGHLNIEPAVSKKLIEMIPGFKSSEINSEGVRSVEGLGMLKISSLPGSYRDNNLEFSQADLAVCAAEDVIIDKGKKTKILNASSYIGLEPTDWHMGECFVTDQDNISTSLPSSHEMRLSSIASSQLPDISSVTSISRAENIIMKNIVGVDKINSQLVYGLYPDSKYDAFSKIMKQTGNLDEVTQMSRIVEANLILSKEAKKPSILLLPQKIALNDRLKKEMIKIDGKKIHFVDLTQEDFNITKYKAGDVVVAYTGILQQKIFDHLMLSQTTLPPVIEGCNSRELCESVGRPFIHGSAKYSPLKQYPVDIKNMQELHSKASLCLQQGDKVNLPQLVEYMKKSIEKSSDLTTYNNQRREAFLKRPDACEVALETLGIKYEKDASEQEKNMEKFSVKKEVPSLTTTLREGNAKVGCFSSIINTFRSCFR